VRKQEKCRIHSAHSFTGRCFQRNKGPVRRPLRACSSEYHGLECSPPPTPTPSPGCGAFPRLVREWPCMAGFTANPFGPFKGGRRRRLPPRLAGSPSSGVDRREDAVTPLTTITVHNTESDFWTLVIAAHNSGSLDSQLAQFLACSFSCSCRCVVIAVAQMVQRSKVE
jgi:hypothetical protein